MELACVFIEHFTRQIYPDLYQVGINGLVMAIIEVCYSFNPLGTFHEVALQFHSINTIARVGFS
jgi:hypothetical protein